MKDFFRGYHEVFEAEIKEIRKRRIAQGLNVAALPQTAPRPSIKLGLVGLALSGGGIRSATFNLGLLQALNAKSLFKHIDYLSTVSGGGYIGSCISAAMAESKEFPFPHDKKEGENDGLRHLRSYSNYLAPRGALDRLRLPVLGLRGALVNLFLLLPYVFAAAAVTLILWWYYSALGTVEGGLRVVGILIGLLVVGMLLYPLGQKAVVHFRLDWKWRDWLSLASSVLAGAAMLLMFVALQRPILAGLDALRQWLLGSSESMKTNPMWLSLLLSGLGLVPTLASGMLARQTSATGSKVALYALGLIGPLVVYVLYLGLLAQFTRVSSIAAGDFGFGMMSPLCWLPLQPDALAAACRAPTLGELIVGYATIATAIWLVGWLTIDVNLNSPHGFYRDRLSRAYLFKLKPRPGNPPPEKRFEVVHDDAIKLSKLNAAGSGAPYHIIGATLNVPKAEEWTERGRRSAFFMFSKHFCGGSYSGYCDTRKLEEADAHFDLGTAMAISGAAFSANRGLYTQPALVFILTMLNARLGYWLPNPQRVNDGAGRCRVGPIYFVRELLGRLDKRSACVNVSDGGHLENLGIYELLRRRCRLIIASDAGQDGAFKFEDLGDLVRLARVDWGVQIRMQGIYSICRDKEPVDFAGHLKKPHFAVGSIDYGDDGEKGTLIYIKSSLGGDEDIDIMKFRRVEPNFPHHSTLDQFFDEAQFESYRALGRHVGDLVVGAMTDSKAAEVPDWEAGVLKEALEDALRGWPPPSGVQSPKIAEATGSAILMPDVQPGQGEGTADRPEQRP